MVRLAEGHVAVDADAGHGVHGGQCQSEVGEALYLADDGTPYPALGKARDGGERVAKDADAQVGNSQVEKQEVVRFLP